MAVAEPRHTLIGGIPGDITKILNNTKFEMYVCESYRPVVHGYYLDHPDIPPINMCDPLEQDNLVFSHLPLINIIDLLATGQHFRFKYSSDVTKAAGFLKIYINQFEGIALDNHPDQKAFLDKVKLAYDKFSNRAKEIDQRGKPLPKKRLSVADRIRALGL